MVAKITAVLKLIRVRQWVKNLFVFAPLVFSLQLFNAAPCLQAVTAFFAFCLVSGSLYAMNDIIDLERDKHHPRKKNRPLPAGILTIPESAVIGALCLGFGFFMAFLLDITVAVILFIYLLMNVYYSLWGKNIIVFDTMLIAIGFVLRVLAGAYAIAVRPSSWMLVATFFLALLLGLGKRYNELRVLEGDSANHRQVLEEYSEPFLRQLFAVASSATIVAYALYTMDHQVIAAFQTENLVFTLPFVVFGVFRYLYLVFKHDLGGDPTEMVYRDRPLLLTVVLWGILVIALIYR
ncbi:MAG: decaprenyl-phosphate phosphoribosyltransferase [Syntrophomonadales bacterium]|jgi:4-hydroxybenzoate polyprenyltransferase